MFKTLVAAASVTALLAATAPIQAEAHWYRGGFHAGPAIAFGALAGLAVGAAVVASAPPAVVYAPPPAYYGYPPAYYAPPPAAYAPAPAPYAQQ